VGEGARGQRGGGRKRRRGKKGSTPWNVNVMLAEHRKKRGVGRDPNATKKKSIIPQFGEGSEERGSKLGGTGICEPAWLHTERDRERKRTLNIIIGKRGGVQVKGGKKRNS